MAESTKKDHSSKKLKEKDSLLDMDIGKDFLSSWKSISMEEGDIDFDIVPVSKGNKKSFNFDKADTDFNLDGDFGNMPSFNMDIPDFDISPPLKKDAKSKEKPKESSGGEGKGTFNMDMSDFDTSPPLKKDAKSKEKPKESSGGEGKGTFNMDMSDFGISPPLKKDVRSKEKSKESSGGEDKGKNGKTDGFAFTFDFDGFENLNFESSLEKESPKVQKDKNDKESSSTGSWLQDKESSMLMNKTGSMSTSEDGPQEPPLLGTVKTFDKNSVGGEPTGKNFPSSLAKDGAITSENSAAIDEVGSDIAKIPPETTIALWELPKISQSEELVSSESVVHEACGKNDDMPELPSEYLHKPSGVDLQDKVDSIDTNATESKAEDNISGASIAASTCDNKPAMSQIPQHLQDVEASEKKNGERSHVGVGDHVIDNRERTELCEDNSIAVSVISPASEENQELAPEIHKLPLVSQLAGLSKRETENERETPVTISRPSILTEKPECPAQKASTQKTISSLSSKKTDFIQPALVKERREPDSIQSNRKLVSLPLELSKTPLRGELPQIQRQESCKPLKISGDDTEGLKNGKKLTDASITRNEETVKTKSALIQRKTSVKDLNTLSSRAALPSSSMEINKKAAESSGKATKLASITTVKSTPRQEQKLSSIEGAKKTPDHHVLKLSGLTINSTKFSTPKDIKSAGNIGQKKVLLRKTPPSSRSLESQKQTPSTLSMKRKALEEDAGNIISLHPSKRQSQLSPASRNFVETSAKILDKKVLHQNNMEDHRIKVTIGNMANEMKIKGVEISSSIENNNNIKPAEAYNKELDDLCNMLRKKHDEAKEILVKATVNSNKLLMLNNPLLEEKIRATQTLFARLKLDSVRG